MISDATFMGGLQIPPSGDPILLMADRQTTGGYPQIATVITADLPLAGQLAPGDWLEFTLCTRVEAITALVEEAGAAACRLIFRRRTCRSRRSARWASVARPGGLPGRPRSSDVIAAHGWAAARRGRCSCSAAAAIS